MNCFNHQTLVAVGICQDCKKGLCITCISKYTIPICSRCNILRAKSEKSKIMNELFLSSLVGLLFVAFSIFTIIKTSNGNVVYGVNALLINVVVIFIMFYAGASLVAGWKELNSFTSRFFLFLPIVGWVIYFFIKLSIAAMIGSIFLPIRLFKNFKRLNQLKRIPY